MNKHTFFTSLFALIVYINASAQVMTRHFDSSFELDNIVGNYALKIAPFTLPSMDKEALIKAEKRKSEPGPFQFAVNVPVNINSADHGVWSESRTTRRWTLKVTSTGAFSQAIAFRKPQLRPGATLFIFDGNRKMLFGPIDQSNWWGKQERLVSDIIPGESAYIVFSEPITDLPPTRLEIMEISYGYRNVFEHPDGTKDNSPQDLLCAVGDNWRAEARSMARIFNFGANSLCSGFLVNNTDQNLRPFLLTASHCDCSGAPAGVLIQFLIWENTCNTNTPATGLTFVNGVSFRASRVQSDFLLLEMNDDPSASGVVYAGWNRSTTAASSSTSIHHPGGNPMQVAVENSAATVYASGVTHPCGGATASNAMWRVNFDVGSAAPGSSGSPLFNQSHKVVGQLAGPLNEAPSVTDMKFGRFDVSWTGGGTNSTRLSNWLDGEGMGVSSLNAITRILGNDDLCPGGTTYSIPDFRNPGNLAYTYTWTVSNNLTIVSGQNTPNVVISAKTTNPLGGVEGIISVNVTRNSIQVCTGYKIVNARNFPAPADIVLSGANCGSCSWSTYCTSVSGAASYEWKNYPDLETTSGPDIPMGVSALLSVRAIDDVGCLSAWKTKTLTATNTCGCFAGGSEDRSASPVAVELDFQVVPNPADDHSDIFILLPEENATETYQVKVIDLLGKTIFERSGLAGGTQVVGETKEMSAGMYSVQVCSNTGKTATRTLVVK